MTTKPNTEPSARLTDSALSDLLARATNECPHGHYWRELSAAAPSLAAEVPALRALLRRVLKDHRVPPDGLGGHLGNELIADIRAALETTEREG